MRRSVQAPELNSEGVNVRKPQIVDRPHRRMSQDKGLSRMYAAQDRHRRLMAV